MNFFSILVKCFALVSFLLSQDLDSSSLLDIGNEIQQLEKQYSKLPDLFKSKVLPVYKERLDNRLSIKPSSFESRIKINNPSYHWCMAKLYLLSNDTMKLRAHYARYLSLIDTDNDVPLLFKQPIQ